MTPYNNLHGNSNVEAYDTKTDSIHVLFKNGSIRNYLYTHSSTGMEMVEEMKRLAYQGYGLNSYINTDVKSNFSRKW